MLSPYHPYRSLYIASSVGPEAVGYEFGVFNLKAADFQDAALHRPDFAGRESNSGNIASLLSFLHHCRLSSKKGGGKKAKEVAATTRKHCNCKNSRCLKLYCECFASGRYCSDCNCVSCCNNQENESFRQAAVETILDRNPNAFRPKIQVSLVSFSSMTSSRLFTCLLHFALGNAACNRCYTG